MTKFLIDNLEWKIMEEKKRFSIHSSIHILKGEYKAFGLEYTAEGLVVDGELYPNSIKKIQIIDN